MKQKKLFGADAPVRRWQCLRGRSRCGHAGICGVLCAVLCIVFTLPVAASSDSTSNGAPSASQPLLIEQAQAKAPQINVWFRGGATAPKADALQAALGGIPLRTESVRAVSPQDAHHLYFLVDCSTSTSAAQLAAVKQALLTCANSLAPGQRVTLLSFGVEVKVLVQDEQSPEAICAAVETLQADEAGTRFFDALAETARLAGCEALSLTRKSIFVFSDSVDYNLGGYTQEEVDALLMQAGAPLYALGFDTGAKAGLDALGALTRSSGGAISIVSPATLQASFTSFLEELERAYVAQLTAPDNRAAATAQPLTLTLGPQTAERQVCVRYSVADTQAPRVVAARQQTEDTLIVVFSENVTGAEKLDSYAVRTQDGSLLGLSAAAYDAQSFTATLTLAQPPSQATLDISCPGITDASAQQNSVEGGAQLDFTGPLASTAAAGGGAPLAAWALLTLVGVAVLLGVAFAAIKRRGGLVLQNGKLHFGGAPAQTQMEAIPLASEPAPQDKVHFVQASPMPAVVLSVTGANGQARRVEIAVSGTLFVGRGDMCDVIFDDAAMSRQHFVLEESGGSYTLTNLSQSSGTRLNGVAVQKPRPLYEGDVIEAGGTRIVFGLAKGGGT